MPGSTYSQNNWFFRWPDCPHPLYYPFPLPTHCPPNFQEEGKTFLCFALDTSYSNMTSFLTFPSLLNKMIFTKRKLDLKLTLCYWKHANPHHLWNQNSSLKLKYQASPKTHLQVPAFTLGAPFRPETLRRLCFRPSCTWARVLPLPTLSPAPPALPSTWYCGPLISKLLSREGRGPLRALQQHWREHPASYKYFTGAPLWSLQSVKCKITAGVVQTVLGLANQCLSNQQLLSVSFCACAESLQVDVQPVNELSAYGFPLDLDP